MPDGTQIAMPVEHTLCAFMCGPHGVLDLSNPLPPPPTPLDFSLLTTRARKAIKTHLPASEWTVEGLKGAVLSRYILSWSRVGAVTLREYMRFLLARGHVIKFDRGHPLHLTDNNYV